MRCWIALVESCVNGICINRGEDEVRRGFDPGFALHVLDDGELIQAPLDLWLARLNVDGVKSASRYDRDFDSIEVAGDSAVVKMNLYEDPGHLYTDYLGLYRFADGWKS